MLAKLVFNYWYLLTFQDYTSILNAKSITSNNMVVQLERVILSKFGLLFKNKNN